MGNLAIKRSVEMSKSIMGMAVVMLILLLTPHPGAGAEDYSRELAEVASGERTEAKAVWWGYDPEDATACLQAAINSGVEKLIVDNVGSDWLVGPIQVAGNIEIVFRDGVVIRAKEGGFKGRYDRLFNISGKKNVTLRGEGDVLFEMRKSDYQDPSLYEQVEWRHTINIWNSQDVLIQNLTLRKSGGDGIYVGCNPAGPTSKNIVIDRVVSEDHHRQAISVTGATNLLLKDSKFNDTSGTAPQCGLDLEPNFSECSIVNFRAVNCDFNGNAASGILITLFHFDETTEAVTMTFENCRIRDNNRGVRLHHTGTGTPPEPGRIEFIDCEISGTLNQSLSIGSPDRGRLIVENMELIFRNTVIDNRGSNFEAVTIANNNPTNIHGLRIEGLTVIDDEDRPPIKFISRFGNGLVDAVVKDVRTVRSDGTEIVFDTETFLTETSAPDPGFRDFTTLDLQPGSLEALSERGKVAGTEIRYRGFPMNYLQYAEAGQSVDVGFIHRPTQSAKSPIKASVFDPDNIQIDSIEIPFGEKKMYNLAAEVTGVYRFEVRTRSHLISIETDAPGQGFLASETGYRYLRILGASDQKLYFHVPAGVQYIQVEATRLQWGSATVFLLDPEGREVDSGVQIEDRKILRHSREDASEDEVWSLRFSASQLGLRIGAPLLPIFSSDPDNLIVGVAADWID